MGQIHVLDTEISNKIAAGEVVERPASVIKELVENSIDANATAITVEIKSGGASYMRVTDNGCGMSEDDARVCFLRHATSKIHTESDLDAIYTLGFRGEALSSIGAVSEVSLYTKRKEAQTGICVTCKGGEILSSDDAGTPDGTTMVVENLFYNTPARLKFLKKDAAETGYITDIITRMIFAHPEISFRLIVSGKEKLFSAGDNNLQNAVYAVYGKDYAKGTISVEYDSGDIKVRGLVGKGSVSTAKRTHQSFFVNKRYIKSPLMIRALEEAYKNQIMIGKFPFAVLNIEINPSQIDINVHPTKLEIKFSDEQAIYKVVYYSVKDALYAIPNVPKIERTENNSMFKPEKKKEQLNLTDLADNLPKNLNEKEERQTYIPKNMTKRPETPLFDPMKNPYMNTNTDTNQEISLPDKESASDNDSKNLHDKYSNIINTDFSVIDLKDNVNGDISENKPVEYENKEKHDVEECIDEDKEKIDNSDNISEENNVFIDDYFEIVGQVFDTYIIAEKNNEMMIIDQHAAHERLKYEELKKEIASKQVMSQMLIEPVIIDLTGEEISAFSDNLDTFNEMGFECDEFGDNSIIVRAVPGGIELGEVELILKELIFYAKNLKKELISDKKQCIMYNIACKTAIKANHRLSLEEMKYLVRDVLRLENINTCPHGRPIIVTMSKKELEKEFKRIV